MYKHVLELVFLVVILCKGSQHHSSLVQNRAFYTSGPKAEIFISSFVFNPPLQQPSEWIDYILGNLSITREGPALEHISRKGPPEGYLPTLTNQTSCSVEILGFTPISTNLQQYASEQNKGSLYLKDASFHMYEHKSGLVFKANCLYRVTGFNGYFDSFTDYLFVYCPMTKDTCAKFTGITKKTQSTNARLIIKMNKLDIETAFKTNNVGSSRKRTKKEEKGKELGLCLVKTYHEIEENITHTINSAIFLESIRYYTNLGFRIAVYDRDGVNRQLLYGPPSPYAISQNISNELLLSRVDYYPFSIFQTTNLPRQKLALPLNLNFSKINMSSIENNITTRDLVLKITDDDKSATLTHCRFELNALYGISDVLVVDPDEFLYFQRRRNSSSNDTHNGLTYKSQAKELRSYMESKRKEGYGQLNFHQKTPMFNTAIGPEGRSLSVKECMYKKIKSNSSLFECYATVIKQVKSFRFKKAFSLGLRCPVTHFHYSCPYKERRDLCECNSIQVPSAYVLHITHTPKVCGSYALFNCTPTPGLIYPYVEILALVQSGNEEIRKGIKGAGKSGARAVSFQAEASNKSHVKQRVVLEKKAIAKKHSREAQRDRRAVKEQKNSNRAIKQLLSMR